MENDCSDGACRPGRVQPNDARDPRAPSDLGPLPSAPAGQFRLVRSGCPLKVLVVEDDMIVATDLAAIVEEQGGTVVGTASDSRHAIELGLAHHPDIVLMDVMLRGQPDGIHAAEVIRDLVGSTIVFCTGNADPETMRRMQTIDGAVIVLKPVLSLELCQAIAKVLRTDTPS
jgi:DNA-binding NarL/FixJ family response regulator